MLETRPGRTSGVRELLFFAQSFGGRFRLGGEHRTMMVMRMLMWMRIPKPHGPRISPVLETRPGRTSGVGELLVFVRSFGGRCWQAILMLMLMLKPLGPKISPVLETRSGRTSGVGELLVLVRHFGWRC